MSNDNIHNDMSNKRHHAEGAFRRLWIKTSNDMNMGIEIDESEMETALDVFRKNRARINRRAKARLVALRVMRYAALLALPIVSACLTYLYMSRDSKLYSEMSDLYVADGSLDSLRLSDDTKVTVNAGSSMIYPKRFNPNASERGVFVNGEARFEVTKDPNRPFIVHVANLNVKVLGTHFSVKSYSEDPHVTVTLEEGLVKVYDNRHTMFLHPNEQLVYDRRNGNMTKSRIDAVAANSWTKGELDFKSRSLEEILGDLERKYRVKFKVMASVDINKRYTMNFRSNESIDNVLEVLTVVSGNISYKKQRDQITLYTQKKGGI